VHEVDQPLQGLLDPGALERLELARGVRELLLHDVGVDVVEARVVLVEGGARDRGLLAQLGDGDAAGVLDLQQLKARGAHGVQGVGHPDIHRGVLGGVVGRGVHGARIAVANGLPYI